MKDQQDIKDGRGMIPREWSVCSSCLKEWVLDVKSHQVFWDKGEIHSAYVTIKIADSYKNDAYDF